MTLLLAHHVELHHVPVLLALFTAGYWIGWRGVAGLLARRTSRIASSAERSAH
jgi:hypothetical protein